jgi:hypoxanthine-DNA glycosylase
MAKHRDKLSSLNQNTTSFLPIASNDTKILILGSIPGKISISDNEYYAHPRNLFWHMVDINLNISKDLPYQTRITELVKSKIALWDVFYSCNREGSLDSNIKDPKLNDLNSFLAQHRELKKICFNGKMAKASFDQFLKKEAQPFVLNLKIKYLTLPSTSPANASISYQAKKEAWESAFKL